MAKSTLELERKIIESTARLLAMGLEESTIVETVMWERQHIDFSLDIGLGGGARERQIRKEIFSLATLLETKAKLTLKTKDDVDDIIYEILWSSMVEAKKHLSQAIKQVQPPLPATPDEIKRRKALDAAGPLPLTPDEVKKAAKAAFARKPLPFTPLELSEKDILNAILTLARKELSQEAIMKTLNAMLTAEKTEEDTFELSTTETTANEQDEIGLIEPTENVLIIGGKRIQATPQEMIPILEAFEKLTRFLKNNGRGALSKILAKAENEHQAAFRSIPPLPPVPPNKVRELVAKLALTKIPLPTIPPRGAVVAAPASNAKEGAPRSKVGEMAKQYAQKVEAAQRGKAIPPIKAAKEDKNKKDGKDADKKSGQRPGTPGVGG